ncbi:MAG: ABC transporter permease [Mesoaciditoga sp.]|uniref:carbohydrate ABC transporter permease n=1 Tax=Athalassotoga sp. TaxID=2022597 RepID=UPI000CAA9C87|nr:MAG: ABC transporter permease [Mesoaciditoga sp.]HEU23924.1 carbohydrate ABC transporter permease [Mesoaciditoga lauensis]
MRISKRIAIYTVLIIASIFFLFPIYMLIVTSLKSLQEVNTTSSWSLPVHIDLSGFVTAWNGISQGFVNSFEFTIPALIFSVFLGSIGGFALTKVKFKGSNTVFLFLLFGMFLPYQVVLIPLVKFMATLGLYGNIWSLIITHTAYGIPITTLIFRNFYSSIPTSLLEAGQVDGANTLQIYARIILPLSIPGIVVASIWQFTNIWNNFLFGLVLGSMPDVRPVTVMLNNLNGAMMAQWNTLMAGALITAIPTLIVYLIAGKYFVKGLLGGAVKG